MTDPVGEVPPHIQRSACTFTTFDHLANGAVYLRDPLPLETELLDSGIADYAWGGCGPMRYEDVAHVLIPQFFSQPMITASQGGHSDQKIEHWNEWEHEQDIEGLSRLLTDASIEHSLTEWVLELKRF